MNGRVSHLDGLVPEDSDSAGRGAKQTQASLRLEVRDGQHGAHYGSLVGWPYMNPACTEIRLLGDADKWNGREFEPGRWLVTVLGNRLQAIFDQVCETRRISLKVSGPVEGKAEVLRVEIERVED